MRNGGGIGGISSSSSSSGGGGSVRGGGGDHRRRQGTADSLGPTVSQAGAAAPGMSEAALGGAGGDAADGSGGVDAGSVAGGGTMDVSASAKADGSLRVKQEQQQQQQQHASSPPVQPSAAGAGAGATGGFPRVGPAPAALTEEETARIDAAIAALMSATDAQTTADVETCLDCETIMMVCERVGAFFMHEPPLLALMAPINIVGDIHGQFLDLLRYFEVGGMPPEASYLFLGDYIDRGTMGMECTILLFCFKLRYPGHFFMLRGNHECMQISRLYGFYDECHEKYDVACWEAVNAVFMRLPLAATVNNRLFATHGGLSPDLVSLDDINRIHRPTEVPIEGLLCDLLWADPSADEPHWGTSDRGVSFLFGEKTLQQFLEAYDFDLFVRAHQVVEEGFQFFPKGKRHLVTVFSAANYCNNFDNAGAMLLVDKDLVCSFHVIKPPLADHHRNMAAAEWAEFAASGRPQTPRPD